MVSDLMALQEEAGLFCLQRCEVHVFGNRPRKKVRPLRSTSDMWLQLRTRGKIFLKWFSVLELRTLRIEISTLLCTISRKCQETAGPFHAAMQPSISFQIFLESPCTYSPPLKWESYLKPPFSRLFSQMIIYHLRGSLLSSLWLLPWSSNHISLAM